jgi:hypothetical protein
MSMNPDGPHLTPREEEILQLRCRGTKWAAIAMLLGISPGTVATYRRRLRACRAQSTTATAQERTIPQALAVPMSIRGTCKSLACRDGKQRCLAPPTGTVMRMNLR